MFLLVALAFRLRSLAVSVIVAFLAMTRAWARTTPLRGVDLQNPAVLLLAICLTLESITNSKHMDAISEVLQDYVHKLPVILHDNLQRESCKLYDPSALVTLLQVLRRVDQCWHLHLSECRNTLT